MKGLAHHGGIESRDVLPQVSTDVRIFYSMMCPTDPGLRIGNEFVDQGPLPCIGLPITRDRLIVHSEDLYVSEAPAAIGFDYGSRSHASAYQLLDVRLGFLAHQYHGKARSTSLPAFGMYAGLRLNRQHRSASIARFPDSKRARIQLDDSIAHLVARILALPHSPNFLGYPSHPFRTSRQNATGVPVRTSPVCSASHKTELSLRGRKTSSSVQG